MVDCSTELKRTVPVMRVVKAAVVDMHEDIGRYQQLCLHWAVRGLKKLERESLKTGLKKVTLLVNQNTRSATLPADFSEAHFVGAIDNNGKKVALRVNGKIPDVKSIEDIPCEDKCEKCQQDTSICNELTTTETITLVVVGDSMQEQTVVKKLYPDGSYFLETTIPIWDVESQSVIFTTQKEFITQLDLKPCGCIDETEENIERIRCCCPDVYDCYFSCCDDTCDDDYGGYKLQEESGTIYLDKAHLHRKVYLEYWGFLAKKNGQYQVPEVAFETLVNWVKFKKVENQRNISLGERQWTFDQYDRERKNMRKIMGRVSLSQILYYALITPNFDWEIRRRDCTEADDTISTLMNAPSRVNGSSSGSGSSGSGSGDSGSAGCDLPLTCPPSSNTTSTFTPFDIAVIAGNGVGTPTPGTNVYQNDKLKGALGINFIIVNNTNETILGKQFVLDTVAGTITRYQGDGVTPNDWFAGDILIVPTFFKYVNGQIVSPGVDPGLPVPKVYEYISAGDGDSFLVSGIAGKKIWGVWRAGQFRKPILTVPTDSEHIQVQGTELASNKGIVANGLVGLQAGDFLVPGEQLLFGYYD